MFVHVLDSFSLFCVCILYFDYNVSHSFIPLMRIPAQNYLSIMEIIFSFDKCSWNMHHQLGVEHFFLQEICYDTVFNKYSITS